MFIDGFNRVNKQLLRPDLIWFRKRLSWINWDILQVASVMDNYAKSFLFIYR